MYSPDPVGTNLLISVVSSSKYKLRRFYENVKPLTNNRPHFVKNLIFLRTRNDSDLIFPEQVTQNRILEYTKSFSDLES